VFYLYNRHCSAHYATDWQSPDKTSKGDPTKSQKQYKSSTGELFMKE